MIENNTSFFSILHPVSALDSIISQRAEGSRVDIGLGRSMENCRNYFIYYKISNNISKTVPMS